MYNHNIIKNTFIYIFSNALGKGIPFLLLPILTRYLSPSDYGRIATFQIVLAFMVVFVGLNSNGAVMVNFFKMKKQELGIYIGNVFFLIFINFIFISGLVYVLGFTFSNLVKFPKLWLFILVFVALGQVIISLNLVLWQAEQKPFSYGFFNVSKMLTNVTLSLFFIVLLGWKWQGRLLGITVASFIFSFIGIFVLYKRKYISFSFNKEHIKDMLFFGIPLIPHALGGWIMTGIDRLFINSMVNVTATGIYTVGYQVGMIIGVLATSFNIAWTPFLFEKLKENNYSTKIRIVKYTYLYCICLIGLAVFIGVVSSNLLGFLVDKAYYGASKYVIWIAMGYAFEGIYLVIGNYIFFVKKTYLLSIITFFSAILNLGLNYILINKNGALGAAQATCLTYFVFCIFTWVLSAKVYKMPWRLLKT